jgi:aminoglycoside 6'-N-acetyltransferase I
VTDSLQIVDLTPSTADWNEQAARLLVDGFRQLAPESWPDMESARRDVRDMLSPDRIALAATDRSRAVRGWIGGIPAYDGNVWELHPLVVQAGYRRRGIGRQLVQALESRARARGGCTLWAGSDDEVGWTSAAGIDLYPDLWRHIRDLRDVGGHPFAFYLKLGFVVAGLLPDANGPGKPDIFLAKRIRP